MRLLHAITLTVVLMSGISLSAQTDQEGQADREDQLDIPRSSDPGRQPIVRRFIADEIEIWTSPFRRRSYSGRGFKGYVIPFALISGALIATDHRSSHVLPNTEDQGTWSRRVSEIGAPYTLAGMSATMYLISRATGNKRARETGFLGALAIGHSQVVTQGLKLVSRRERPYQFKANRSGGTAFWKGGNSFPSGHSSSSFALATIFAYEYGPRHRWVPYASYGLASIVAASRLAAERHWASDIFVGGTMGFMIGRYVYKAHHNPNLNEESMSKSERFIPQLGVGPRGLTLTWNL